MPTAMIITTLSLLQIIAGASLAQAQEPPPNWREKPLEAGFVLSSDNPPKYHWINDRKSYQDIAEKFEIGRPVSFHTIMYMPPRVVWDIHYNYDALGRRRTVQNDTPKKEFLVVLGCSFAFGTGLNDKDTLPSQLARVNPRYRIYNYARSGAGPNEVLRLIEVKRNLVGELKESRGTFLYIYISDQIIRPWAYKTTAIWGGNQAWYEKVGDGFVYRGTIHDVRPLWFGLNQYFSLWFPDTSAKLRIFDFFYPYACDLVSEARKRLLRQYPKSRFLVMIHPQDDDPRFEKCMRERKIELLPKAKMTINASDSIEGDGHPSASFNRRWAPLLMKQLLNGASDGG